MDEVLNLAFKAFGVFDFNLDYEFDPDFMHYDELEWAHPRMIKQGEVNDFMDDMAAMAMDDAKKNYNWFTVVAYDCEPGDGCPPTARYACDYGRHHVGSVDRFCNDYNNTCEVANELTYL